MKQCVFCQSDTDEFKEVKVEDKKVAVCPECQDFLSIMGIEKSKGGKGYTFKLKYPIEALNRKQQELYDNFLNTISARKRAQVQKMAESGQARVYKKRRK